MDSRYYDPEIETAPRDKLRTLQGKKLNTIVRHAWDKSPFYRKKFEEANLHPDDIRSIDDVRKIPFATKDDLRTDQQDNSPWGSMVTLPVEECQRIHMTSGTTGQPMRVLDTAEDWANFVHAHARMLWAYGVRKHDMVMPAFGFGPFIGFWATYYAAEKIGCTLLATGGFRTEQRINALTTYPVTAMGCTPSYAIYMAEEAKKRGIDLKKDAKIRITWHTGEPGGGIPAVVKKVEDVYGCKAFDFIGSTEIGPFGFNCEYQSGLTHMNDDFVLAEVLDLETDQPVEPGKTGELVLTNLYRRATPFIRYRTRDIVRVADRTCQCGRTLFALEGSILGRLDDMKKVRGILIYPSRIEEIVRAFTEVEEYQVIFRRVQGLDEIVIKVDPAADLDGNSYDDVKQSLEKALHVGINIRVTVEFVDHGSLPRWDHKAKRVVDEREDVPF